MEKVITFKNNLELLKQNNILRQITSGSPIIYYIQYFFNFLTERGKFLALDLGGTNFRVLIINLGANHFDMQSKIYAIPNHIMTGTGIALFDHIAECLANFMKVGNSR